MSQLKIRDKSLPVDSTLQNGTTIKRTKKHEAILKIKEVEEHIQMMKKRHQKLKVQDQQSRSKTIQHEYKIEMYEKRRSDIKKDRQELERKNKIKQYELETIKQKNKLFKQENEKKLSQVLEKLQSDKIQSFQNAKSERQQNETIIIKYRQSDLREKQDKKKIVNQMELNSKLNISRYKQNREKQSVEYKSIEFDSLMSMASNREKYLQKLSKMEEEMVKKHSESMQVNQAMKNRLREVLGNQRRYLKLPSIISKNNTLPTRGSTGQTHILSI